MTMAEDRYLRRLIDLAASIMTMAVPERDKAGRLPRCRAGHHTCFEQEDADRCCNPDYRRELRLRGANSRRVVGAGRYRRRGAADLLEVAVVTIQVFYLLHFDNPFKHARHYLGSAVQLERRLADHRNGTGARLMFWVARAGISRQLARTWRGGRQPERQLKAQGGGHSRHCPDLPPPGRPGRCQS